MNKQMWMPFPPISRGTSMRIPISMKKENGDIFDLTNYDIHFTLKNHRADCDYDDDRAFIIKTGVQIYDQQTPPQPIKNRLDIVLTSQDTWLPDGNYYFDLELIHKTSHAITRFATFHTEIIGGPTNNTIGQDTGSNTDTFFYSDAVHCTIFEEGMPIVVVAPLYSQVPDHIVESFSSTPDYTWNGDMENPKIWNYSSRCTFITTNHTENVYTSTTMPDDYDINFNPGDKVINWSDSILYNAKITVTPDTSLMKLSLEDTVDTIQLWRTSKPIYKIDRPTDNPLDWTIVEKTNKTNNIITENNVKELSFIMPDDNTNFTIYIKKSVGTDDQQEIFIDGRLFIVSTTSIDGITHTKIADWLMKTDWICLGKER